MDGALVGKPKYCEKKKNCPTTTLSTINPFCPPQIHFVHHKSTLSTINATCLRSTESLVAPNNTTRHSTFYEIIKQPGRWVDHLTQSSAAVKERAQPHLYSPSVPEWDIIGWTFPSWYRVFFNCLTDKRWPYALPALSRRLRVREVQQSMTGPRQTIAVIITFRKSNENSIERRVDAYWSSKKKNTL